jgi:hypothetical protein
MLLNMPRPTILKISSALIALMSLGCLGFFGLQAALAASSTNFELNQDRGGPIEYSGNSANYDIKAEVGHPGVGKSTSTNYVYDHGTIWLTSATGVEVTVRWAVPELRVGGAETNDDAVFYLTVRTPQDTDDVLVYAMPNLATSSNDGTYATTVSLGVAPGTYDIGIKTQQHITKLVQDVALVAGTTTVLNFTNTYNTSTKGSQVLLSGDVSGAGDSTSTLGDDVVNSVDLSILIPKLDADDLTGNAERPNLNQDIVINSVDLSMLIKNLDLQGEK